MSRVVCLEMDEGAVAARCQSEKVGVSAVEPLPGGGVRLVCMSSKGAATIRKKLKTYVMDEGSTRERHRPTNPLW